MGYQTLYIITIALYLVGAMVQWARLTGRLNHGRWLVLGFGFIATVLHGGILHRWIDVAGGQNLSFFNVLSLVAWLNALLIVQAALRKPLHNLALFAYPLAAFSMALVLIFPNQNIIDTGADPKQLIHILLAILAFSVLCVTAWQALVLALQNSMLRSKKAGSILQVLPPLETMESLLFQMVGLGFVLLSVVLLSSFIFFDNIFSHALLQKTVLSIFAWCVFATLLLGRFCFGWRGVTAVRWTLSGFVLLALSYFGSRVLLEVLI